MKGAMPTICRALLLASAVVSVLLVATDAFSAQKSGRIGTAVSPPTPSAQPAPPDLFRSVAGRSHRKLFMTSEDENSEKPAEVSEEETPPAASESSEAKTVAEVAKMGGNKKEGSGLVAALFLGPPLFAKFVIVLIVKFMTDLVVFPLLFLYRMARLGKNKILAMMGKGGDIKEKVNGDI